MIITGAGPCGLLLAVLLARDGINVTVLDGASELDNQPRACHYAAPANVVLQRAGVLDQIKKEGFLPRSVCWRTADGTRVAGLSNADTPESDVLRVACLPLGRVVEILHERAVAAGATVKFNHLVTSLGQDDDKAWVRVRAGSEKEERVEAEYIIGCDGANSQIRRSLFGDMGFPGWTWEEQIIATNVSSAASRHDLICSHGHRCSLSLEVYYDFEQFGFEDANFIIHPEDWYMAAKITKDGMWRVTYGDIAGLTKAEYEQRLPMRYKEILPGHPEPDQYRVTNVGPYKIHQRCAKKMRVGRFLLAGDAAHLCNPL